ncbi:MAG: hypothetical protein ONB23_00625 [candidate division KSB1 bacterium]|nr:hypothetical protein [candidate division KSB1 bacterium]
MRILDERNRRLEIWICCLAFLLAGCKNPFATREPEPPSASRAQWTPPYQPEDVLSNLRTALTDRSIVNYVRCLSDSLLTGKIFRFEPEPAAASAFPGVFERWGLEEERHFAEQLFQAVPKDSVLRLQWSRIGEQVGEGGERLLVTEYLLEAGFPQGFSSAPRRCQGRAEFWLVRDPSTSYWYIWRWTDRATVDAPAWSVLKAVLGR